MKQGPSPKGLNAAIWLLALGPAALMTLLTLHQVGEEVGGLDQWLQTLPVSLMVSVTIFAVVRVLVRKHGEQEVRRAAERATKIIGPLVVIAVLLFIFGLPLFFFWLGGRIWGGS